MYIEALEDVTLDAGRMVGVKQFWSHESRDDLTITDIRLAGTTDHSITKDVTFGLKDTDFNTGLTALFESQSLVRQGALQTGSELRLNLKDLGTESNPYNPAEPLGQLNVDGFRFKVGEKTVTLQSDEILAAKTYSELFAAVQAALAAAQAEDATLAGLEVRIEENGFRAPGAYFGENDIRTVEGDSIVIRDQDGRTLEGAGWLQNGDTVDFTLYGRQTNEGPQIITNLIESNLVLDNAGRGSMGGDVVIGGMSGTRGVEKINVVVDRDSQISSLNTGTTFGQRDLNNLEISSTGANGNLTIGQLINVQNVNATAFEGSSMTLSNVQVGQGFNIGATENAGVIGNYHYNMSGANNTLTFNVNAEAAASSNFSLNINTRGGNDVINVNTANNTASQWAQHSELQNISINSTGGNNTVTLGQYGAATVKTGAGSDYIRTDDDGNLANNAQWLVNADISGASGSVLGGGNQTHNFFKTKVVVEFMGIKTDAVLIQSNNFRTTSEQINNAIKQAIANDPDLSKLLRVEDVRNEGLKITTTFDKELVAGDLDIQFLTPKLQGADGAGQNLAEWAARETVSATELASAHKVYANSNSAGTNANAENTAVVLDTLFNTVNGLDGSAATVGNNTTEQYAVNQINTGSDSSTLTMNVVNAGAGHDTIVLSSNQTNGFDTVKFEGNFGHNTIVNFNTNTAGVVGGVRDVLDFTSYLDPAAASRGTSNNTADRAVDRAVDFQYNVNPNPTVTNVTDSAGNTFGYHNTVNYVELSSVWQQLSPTAAGNPKSFQEISVNQLERALANVYGPNAGASTDLNGMKFVVILAQNNVIARDADGNAVLGAATAPTEGMILTGTVNVSSTTGAVTYTLDKQGTISLAGAFSDLSDITAASVAGTADWKTATDNAKAAIKDASEAAPTQPQEAEISLADAANGFDAKGKDVIVDVPFGNYSEARTVLINNAKEVTFKFTGKQTLILSENSAINANKLIVSGGTVDATAIGAGLVVGSVELNSGLVISEAQAEAFAKEGIAVTSTSGTPSSLSVKVGDNVVTLNVPASTESEAPKLILTTQLVELVKVAAPLSDDARKALADAATKPVADVIKDLVAAAPDAVADIQKAAQAGLKGEGAFDASSLKGTGATVDLSEQAVAANATYTLTLAKFDAANNNKSDLEGARKSDFTVKLPALDKIEGVLKIVNMTIGQEKDADKPNDVLDFSATENLTKAQLIEAIEAIEIESGAGTYLNFTIKLDNQGKVVLENVINQKTFDGWNALEANADNGISKSDGEYTIDDAGIAALIGLLQGNIAGVDFTEQQA